MADTTDFGERMKLYEGMEARRKLIPLLPAFARLDGKNFHNWTRGMERPYDERLSALMIDTTIYLVKETNACMGYVQSDEITLAWHSTDFKSQIFFDGKIQKMVSVLSSLCTGWFNKHVPSRFPLMNLPIAHFDCRVWNVPNIVEGVNVFLWREQDATRNSISMAAQSVFSHKELYNKNGPEMQEMLFGRGINWNDYLPFFKRGTFVQKQVTTRKFTSEELESLPTKHEARTNPDLMIERSDVKIVEMPPFGKVVNRPEVIFQGAEPKME